jgi:hypothetical protein
MALLRTNTLVQIKRDGTILDAGRRAFFSYALRQLPPMPAPVPFGAAEQAVLYDSPSASWQKGDIVTLLALDGYVDGSGNPLLPDVTVWLVETARRPPGLLPVLVLSLTGIVGTN